MFLLIIITVYKEVGWIKLTFLAQYPCGLLIGSKACSFNCAEFSHFYIKIYYGCSALDLRTNPCSYLPMIDARLYALHTSHFLKSVRKNDFIKPQSRILQKEKDKRKGLTITVRRCWVVMLRM